MQLVLNSIILFWSETFVVPRHDVVSFCQQVIDAAMESGSLPNYGVLLKVLRSERVDLAQVASDLVVAVKESLREDAQRSDTTLPATNGTSDTARMLDPLP